MSVIEAELEPQPALHPLAIRVRLAGPRDIDELCELLDDRQHARDQVLSWLETPGTTLLVAQSEVGVLGVAVLVTRLVPLSGTGAHKVIEVDNLVVRADQRGRRVGRRLLAAAVEWSRQRRADRAGQAGCPGGRYDAYMMTKQNGQELCAKNPTPMRENP